MKSILLVLLACAWLVPTVLAADPKEPKHYVIYAQFLDNTPVDLSTGAKWMMDKGDCFPVFMFKEQQTKVILKLDTATFMTDTAKVRIMKDSETAAALASYQKNVAEFTKTQSAGWKKAKDAANVRQDKAQ